MRRDLWDLILPIIPWAGGALIASIVWSIVILTGTDVRNDLVSLPPTPTPIVLVNVIEATPKTVLVVPTAEPTPVPTPEPTLHFEVNTPLIEEPTPHIEPISVAATPVPTPLPPSSGPSPPVVAPTPVPTPVPTAEPTPKAAPKPCPGHLNPHGKCVGRK
jgi:hypothetical protein